MRRTLRVIFLALIACLLGTPGIRGAALSSGYREFRSKKHGYSLQYPARWRLNVRGDDFYIENFPVRRFVRGVRLPPEGAGIVVGPLSEFVYPLELRSAEGARLRAAFLERCHLASIRPRRLTLTAYGRSVSVDEYVTSYFSSPPFLVDVTWLFDVDRRTFLASLSS